MRIKKKEPTPPGGASLQHVVLALNMLAMVGLVNALLSMVDLSTYMDNHVVHVPVPAEACEPVAPSVDSDIQACHELARAIEILTRQNEQILIEL
jgi:hypothetical protein